MPFDPTTAKPVGQPKKFNPATATAPPPSAYQSTANELSILTQQANPVAAYNALPEWQKPLVALDDMARIAADTASFGYVDKLQGPGERAKTQAARERAGWAAPAMDVTTAVAALPSAAAKIPSLAWKYGGPALRMFGYGVEGAGMGALSAAGHDEDIGEGAKYGGLFGMGGGALGETVGAAVGAGLRKGGELWQNLTTNPPTRAALELHRAANAAKVTPEKLSSDVAALGPEGMVGDVLGNRGGSLGRKQANVSPEARTILEEATGGRKAGQNPRIAGAFEEAADIPQGNRKTVQELVDWVRREKQPPISQAYKEAAAAGYDLPRTPFEDLHKAPMFEQAYKAAAPSLLNRVATEGADAASELARLDETKKILDDINRSGKRTGDLNKAGQAGDLARALRERLDQQMGGPEYNKARAAAKSSFEAQEAPERGAKLAGNRVTLGAPKEAKAITDPEQRALQKKGFAIQTVEDVLKKDSTEAVPNQMSRPLHKEAIESVFDPEEVAIINQRLEAEKRFNRFHKDVTGNSTTMRQIMEAGGGFGLGGAVGYLQGGDPVTAFKGAVVGGLAPHLGHKMLAARQAKIAPEIARLLTAPARELSLNAPIPPSTLERLAPEARKTLARLIQKTMLTQGGFSR